MKGGKFHREFARQTLRQRTPSSVTCRNPSFRAILFLPLEAHRPRPQGQLPLRSLISSEVHSCCSLRNRSTLQTRPPPTVTLRSSRPPHPWIRPTSDARSSSRVK